MIARHVTVSGRVQGVGFREGLVAVATKAGLVGWVRNRIDGTVEALLQGEDAAVERVSDWCRHGPPAARVSHADVRAVDLDGSLRAFTRRPTV